MPCYECPYCGYWVRTDEELFECPDCGHELVDCTELEVDA